MALCRVFEADLDVYSVPLCLRDCVSGRIDTGSISSGTACECKVQNGSFSKVRIVKNRPLVYPEHR